MNHLIDESKQKYKAEYKYKKFKTESGFKKWLKKTARYEILFQDNGQDCLNWIIDEGGEILHSNLQSSIWNGKIVSFFDLMIGKPSGTLVVEEETTQFYNFIVKRIKQLK